MPRNDIQGIAEKVVGTAQSGAKNIVKEIGAQASQAVKTTGQQIGVLPTIDDKTVEGREAEEQKKTDQKLAETRKKLVDLHREEVDRLTQPTTAPKPAPPVEKPAEPKATLPPLSQSSLPSSPQKGPSFKPTKGQPFIGTTGLATHEGERRKG